MVDCSHYFVPIGRIFCYSMIDISHQREMRASQRVAMLSIPPDARPIGARSNSISKIYQQQRQTATLFLERIHSNFFDDARSLTAGTIPQSIIVAIVVGTVCGIACFVYNSLLEYFLELFWTTLPQKYIAKLWDENYHWLWIPLVSLTNCLVVGLAVRCLGEPGDLPYTISRVHQQAYIPMNHVFPMMVASLFSILAGGSLGPEAPLVAICGALGGFVSRHIFRQNYVNVVRKHTLMGMSGEFMGIGNTRSISCYDADVPPPSFPRPQLCRSSCSFFWLSSGRLVVRTGSKQSIRNRIL